MGVVVVRVGRRYYLEGKTYPIRSEIKRRGGRWDETQQAWYFWDEGEVARELASLASSETAMGYYTIVSDGSWGVFGRNLVVGRTVTVLRRVGCPEERVVTAILTNKSGWQTATLEGG